MFRRHTFPAVAVLGLLALSSAVAQTIPRVKLTDNDLSCAQIYAETEQMDTAMTLAGPGLPAATNAQANGQQNLPAAQANATACVAVPGIPGCADAATAKTYTDLQARQRGAQLALGGMPTQAGLQGQVMVDPNVQAAIARARASGMSEAQINATLGLGMQRGGLGVPAPTMAQMNAPAGGDAAAAGLANRLGAGLAQGGAGGNAAAGLAGLFGALTGGGSQPSAAAAPATAAAVSAVPVAQTSSLGAQAKARKDYLTGLFLTRGCKLSDLKK